ncbi:MAG: hypothetical protein C4538_11525 [Nitrospiraceae bacterium]|nr:MAG: hypothetical protein C4538_11525 [Nitrospiraceae bacterium]
MLLMKQLKIYPASLHTQRAALSRYFSDRQKTFYIFFYGSHISFTKKFFSLKKSILKMCRIEVLADYPLCLCHHVPHIGAEPMMNNPGQVP